MLIRTFSAAAVAVLAAAGLAACNPVNPYAAIVNGDAVTQQQLNAELDAVRGNAQYVAYIDQSSGTSVAGQGTDTVSSQFAADILSRDVAYALVHQELVRRHVHVTSSDRNVGRQALSTQIPAAALSGLPASYRSVLVERNAEVVALENSLVRTPSPADVAAYYQAHQADFLQICARHILVATQAEASGLLGQLNAGADFATVATKSSTDTSTSSQGGDLGCAASNQFASAFGAPVAQLVETAPLNKAVGPVQSQYGWHLFDVSARTQQTLQEATPAIQQQLGGSGQNAIQALLARDLRDAHVDVNPRYGHFALASGQGTVIPPTVPTVRTDQATTATPPGGSPAP